MTRRGRAVRAALLLACVLAVVGPGASVASPVALQVPDVPDRLVDPRAPRDLLDPRPEPAPGVPAPPGLRDPRDPLGPLDPDAGPAPLPIPRADAGSRPVPMPEAGVPDRTPEGGREGGSVEPGPGAPGPRAPSRPSPAPDGLGLDDPRLP